MRDSDPLAALDGELSRQKLADALWEFYERLLDKGFDSDQAFTLTLNLMDHALGVPSGGEGEDE